MVEHSPKKREGENHHHLGSGLLWRVTCSNHASFGLASGKDVTKLVSRRTSTGYLLFVSPFSSITVVYGHYELCPS